MDLEEQINLIRVLNMDEEQSTLKSTHLMSQSVFNKNKSYILSDLNEALIVLIEFKKIVQLHSMKLYASTTDVAHNDLDVSPPKHVAIYKLDHLNIDFDSLKKMKVDKRIRGFVNKMKKGQFVNLKKNSKNGPFENTQHLAIYIGSNQNDTKKTIINGIQLQGSTNVNEATATALHHTRGISFTDTIWNKNDAKTGFHSKQITASLNHNNKTKTDRQKMDDEKQRADMDKKRNEFTIS
eukprot:206430_1